MSRRRKINRSNIIGAILIVASVIATVLTVTDFPQLAFADHSNPCVGPSCTEDGGQVTRPCKTGNCASVRKNGAFWLKINTNSDDINPASLFGLVYNSGHIRGCASHGGAAYVLVTGLSNGGLAGPVDIDTTHGNINNGENFHGSLPPGASIISNQQAQAQFDAYGAAYAAQGQSFTGTHLGWFCAEAAPTTGSTPTTTPPPLKVSCDPSGMTLQREWGATWSRIAVRNRSLDDPVVNQHDNWRPRNSRSPRYAAPNDSGWTMSGGEYWTIAKPGDSVQFLHAYCLNDRYVRRTPTQKVQWVSQESWTLKLDQPEIEPNTFHIGANVEPGYLFGNGISWANSIAASRSELGSPYDRGPFPDRTNNNGYATSSDTYGLILLSPTPDNNAYNCSTVAQYNARDPYVGNASFQIPGFDSGFDCPAASLSGVSNTVGKTVTQWHKFDMIKAWEMYTTDYSGSCSCDDIHDAVWEGYTYSTDWAKPRAHWGHRRDYKCNPGPECVDCCYCIAWDIYGACTAMKGIMWDYHPWSYDWQYESTWKNYGEATKTASVYVPYNYESETSSHIDAGDVIFQGGAVDSNFNWTILPRSNFRTSSFDYATVTPPDSEARMIEFIYDPSKYGNVAGNIMTELDPCSYYSGAIKCEIIEQQFANWNPMGLYDGQRNGASQTRAVPDDDEYVGFKYCVAIGLYPTDSHDYMGNELWQQRSGGLGGAMDSGQFWNISNASCRTIAKKPYFQVWNGSMYTEGNVLTSVFKKMLDIGLGSDYDEGSTTLFGSWVDYSIEAKGYTRGIASGAMLGYNNSSYNLAGPGGQPTSAINRNYKKLSPLTIANTAGGNYVAGYSNVSASSSIDINLNRLRSRYSEKAQAFAYSVEDGGAGGSVTNIRTARTGMQYAYYDGSTSLSSLSSNIVSYSNTKDHPNQTTYKSGNGIYKTLGDGVNDNTLVIYVTGDFTIDGDICLGDRCDEAGMKLINYKSGTNTNEAAELPQVVIFANNIRVSENVSRVDAWLVAPDGEINTCSGYSIGGGLAAHDGYDRYSDGNCYKTLIVNGPVYASKLTLNRTAGAFHGRGNASSDVFYRQYGAEGDGSDGDLGSGIPAEIFNLRADVYLWAYNQAQRYSEAVVTYMRELAPRY